MCREDYYKFTYQFMPHTVFNFGRLMIYRLLRNEEKFIQELKTIWSAIELEKSQFRNESPNFTMDIVQLNFEHTAIILSVPEAAMSQEALYIAIVYDNDENFRYFTYEISCGIHQDTGYSLNEICSDGSRINYVFHGEKDKEIFKNELSEILVYELL